MRKCILVASLLLTSGVAQAEQMRGLMLASNTAAAEQPQQAAPAQQQVQGAPKANAKPTDDRDSSCNDDRRDRDSYRDDDRYDRKPVRHHEGAEHKARRIAARYGVYW
jgi:hypothetical protein